MPMLLLPFVLRLSALVPKAVLRAPPVTAERAPTPTQVLLAPPMSLTEPNAILQPVTKASALVVGQARLVPNWPLKFRLAANAPPKAGIAVQLGTCPKVMALIYEPAGQMP